MLFVFFRSMSVSYVIWKEKQSPCLPLSFTVKLKQLKNEISFKKNSLPDSIYMNLYSLHFFLFKKLGVMYLTV